MAVFGFTHETRPSIGFLKVRKPMCHFEGLLYLIPGLAGSPRTARMVSGLIYMIGILIVVLQLLCLVHAKVFSSSEMPRTCPRRATCGSVSSRNWKITKRSVQHFPSLAIDTRRRSSIFIHQVNYLTLRLMVCMDHYLISSTD